MTNEFLESTEHYRTLSAQVRVFPKETLVELLASFIDNYQGHFGNGPDQVGGEEIATDVLQKLRDLGAIAIIGDFAE